MGCCGKRRETVITSAQLEQQDADRQAQIEAARAGMLAELKKAQVDAKAAAQKDAKTSS